MRILQAWDKPDKDIFLWSDFNKLEIKVKDISNNTLLTYDCIANNSTIISLSSIASQRNGQPIKVEVACTLVTGTNLQNFEMRAYYHASPLEFRFRSKYNCGHEPIKNTVAVAGIESPPKAEAELPQPENCPKTVEGDGEQNTQPSGPGETFSSGSYGGTLGSLPSTGSGLQIVEKGRAWYDSFLKQSKDATGGQNSNGCRLSNRQLSARQLRKKKTFIGKKQLRRKDPLVRMR